MNWLPVLAIGIFLAIVVCGCWLVDRAGHAGAGPSGEPSTDDGVASLGVVIATAVAVNDFSSSDAASSDTSSSEM